MAPLGSAAVCAVRPQCWPRAHVQDNRWIEDQPLRTGRQTALNYNTTILIIPEPRSCKVFNSIMSPVS